jgi:glycosyltransferase involved in cell wall biosynthesis
LSKITVIIPTQNNRISLNRAVKSVINQSFIDWELYIVNDSSSNIPQFNDDRVKCIQNEFLKGANGSRNSGIESAAGDYIAFLDDDDEWLPEKLSIQFNQMEKEQSILSFTGKNIFINANLQKYSFRNSYTWMLFFYNFVGTTSSIMVSAEILKSVHGFDVLLQQLQDYDLFLRVKNMGNFSGIDIPLVNYYMDKSDNHVSNNWGNFFKSSFVIWSKQGVFGKLIFPFGILITFLQKMKNAIN